MPTLSNPYSNFIKVSLAEFIESAVRRTSETNPDFRNSLFEFEGSVIFIDINDIGFQWSICVKDRELQIETDYDPSPDLTIRGPLRDFLRVMKARDFNPGEVEGLEISGDMKLAQKVYQVLNSTELDFEELIAVQIGDIPARHLGNTFRWGKQNFLGNDSQLAQFFRTSLVDEAYMVPSRSRVEKFFDDVDLLQADLDRLELRVNRLSK